MNKILFVFALFIGMLGVSCSSDDIEYSTDEYLIKNNITDVVLECKTIVKNNPEFVLLYGTRNDRDWFAVFDKQSAKIINEWSGDGNHASMFDSDIDLNSDYFSFCKANDKNGFVFVENTKTDSQAMVFTLKSSNIVEYTSVNKRVLDIINEDLILIKESRDNNNEDSFCSIINAKGDTYVKYVKYTYIIPGYDNEEFNSRVSESDLLRYGNVKKCIGVRNGKLWVGYYGIDNQFHEVLSERDFPLTHMIYKGYGEYFTLEFKDVSLSNMIVNDEQGVVFILYSLVDSTSKIFISVFENKAYFIEGMLFDYEKSIHNWYHGTIMLEDFVKNSMDAEKHNYIMLRDASLIECNKPLYSDYFAFDGVEPVSLEEGIYFTYKTDSKVTFYCDNFVDGKSIWISELSLKVASNAISAMNLIQKNDNVWTYSYDIVNYDGSKESIKFELNITTGEITYL